MKFFLLICLLLISTPSIASAQQRGKRHASPTRAQTREAEGRLSDMGYWTGAFDGLFDRATRSALIAFQKWEGRPITGQLTIAELEAIRSSASPKAREVGYEHVEVDLDRQVLLMVNDEGGVRVLPVSTGSGKPFMDEGQMSIAYTPRGRFVVYDKSEGWKRIRLDQCITPVTSAAAWRFTEAPACESSQRVMVVFGYQFSPLVK